MNDLPPSLTCNVGLRLSETARMRPNGVAVAVPNRRTNGEWSYLTRTFRELDDDSSRIAAGLLAIGAKPGMRLALLTPPGIDFVALVFALFKAGVVTILIDPGMGRKNLLACLAASQPEGFVGVPLAQAARCLFSKRFPLARHNVTVGWRWFWGGSTLEQLRQTPLASYQPTATQPGDPAAIIFTTGSTGPPKGTLYRHGNFNRQADEIRDEFQIAPGEVDLSGFPLFALFNAAMGVTTVFPRMDFTRPAQVDPRNIISAAADWNATQAFGSPALWNTVGRHCEKTGERLPTLKRVLSAGAPVPPHVLKRIKAVIHPAGEIHTPYGATEALPVATISASEVLGETAARSAVGGGTCVGRRFPGIEWQVIAITDGPLASLAEAQILPPGEIGELIVRGPVVTTEYVTRTDCNPLHKLSDGATFWHRMGDVGYLEPHPQGERFWFCGRKSHRVQTAEGVLYTIPCEAIFNNHPAVYRSALVGTGPAGRQRPVVFVEPWPEYRPQNAQAEARLIAELRKLAAGCEHTRTIERFVIRRALPVDIRHNAKIFREQLAEWAEKRLAE